MRRPPISTLLPCTPLFRSRHGWVGIEDLRVKHLTATAAGTGEQPGRDRKSTRLNSSHVTKSYAVFSLYRCGAHRYLPSCPARRSSDLATAGSASRICGSSTSRREPREQASSRG